MSPRYRQQGIAGGLIAVVLVLILVGFLATQVLSRLGAGTRASDAATARLASVADAIEQYATSAGRLPCPANPALDTGDEAVPLPNVGTCSFPEGTVPWKTIGARREDAFDAWGWKISYRAFSGTAGVAGSLTQPGGTSMVECDTADPGAGATTAVAGVQGGLCVSNADPTLRSTLEASFLANKGLPLTDSGTATTAAYLLVSHGPTGRGAYTTAGVRTEMPMGDELGNTAAAGPFRIRAFSDAGTDPSTATHFDDRLFYRTLPDLVRRTSLAARNWPEAAGPPTSTTAVKFDDPTVIAAGGSGNTGSLGATSLAFGAATVSGFTGASTPTDLSYDESYGTPGIGVSDGTGNLLSYFAGKWLRIDLTDKARWFAITLFDFGTYDFFGTYTERVELRFYDDAVLVGSASIKRACNADGGLASFSTIDPGAVFNRIEVTPIAALDASLNTWDTAFLISEIKACETALTPCETTLAAPANVCP